MRKLFIAILLFAATAHAAPRLFFSDLDSGPKTGGENNKGAYVCVFGEGFGATRGSSTITVGGGAVDNYPVWGATWLWYQKTCFQLGASVSTGNIVMTVGGVSSNTLPFTVRSGAIYFVDINSGSDSNDGSFATPWQGVAFAKNSLSNGDIAYLRSGTWSALDGNGGGIGVLDLASQSGASGSPKAIVGYPGETATFMCDDTGHGQCNDIEITTGGPAAWWTFAEIDLAGQPGTHYIIDWDNGSGGDGLRFIGNKIHGSYSVAVVLQGPMDPSNFLGNDDYDYWSMANGAGAERGYGIYYGGYGTQANVNIEWNRFYNDQGTEVSTVNTAGTAVTWVSGDDFTSIPISYVAIGNAAAVYHVASITDSHHLVLSTSAGTQTSVLLGGGASTKGVDVYGHVNGDNFVNFTVANNEMTDMCEEGANLGGSDDHTVPPWRSSGILGVYNNLFINNGRCDVIKAQTSSGLQVGDGLGGMDAHVYGNTFYLNASGTLGGQTAGDVYMFTASESFDFQNNVHFAAPTWSDMADNFIVDDSGGGTITGTKSLYFPNGNPNASTPSWATSTVSTSDPLFVSPGVNPLTYNFHLQATSPARTGGATQTATSPDKDGCSRPQGATYALGPYEVPVTCFSSPPPTITYYFPGHR